MLLGALAGRENATAGRYDDGDKGAQEGCVKQGKISFVYLPLLDVLELDPRSS